MSLSNSSVHFCLLLLRANWQDYDSVEARVGDTDVNGEPDAQRFSVNSACGDPVSSVDVDTVIKHACGSPLNGKYISLQTLGDGGRSLGVSEVYVYATEMKERTEKMRSKILWRLATFVVRVIVK